MTNSDFLQLLSAAVVISAVVYGIIQGVHFLISRRSRTREAYLKSFDTVVENLSSGNKTSQLSAAILLRRYLIAKSNRRNADLHNETINVISALLRTLPTGVFQKTIGDSLAYASDITNADLQRTNLQDIYLGKKEATIKMRNTDLFLADLSYALIENIDGVGTIFYRAILLNTQIKNCNFSKANFQGADLSNAFFKNVLLYGANFSDATDVPQEISKHLVNGVFSSQEPITTTKQGNGKTIFFSMPGSLSKEDELITKDYKEILEDKGYKVIFYQKDDYPQYGQFNKIRQSITESNAMIAFGLKQINIKNGIIRPNTTNEEHLENVWLSTPWNEIEVGMGLMHKLPILLVKDKEIQSGIFDQQLSECFVTTISSTYDSRKLLTNSDFYDG